MQPGIKGEKPGCPRGHGLQQDSIHTCCCSGRTATITAKECKGKDRWQTTCQPHSTRCFPGRALLDACHAMLHRGLGLPPNHLWLNLLRNMKSSAGMVTLPNYTPDARFWPAPLALSAVPLTRVTRTARTVPVTLVTTSFAFE
jgi:hypothetical protein